MSLQDIALPAAEPTLPAAATSAYSEQALRIACAGDTLIGILAKPQRPAAVGVLIIVGGPQYRAGSHRQFTLLARHLADAGHAVLRFDYRGMGDSSGDARDFLGIDADGQTCIVNTTGNPDGQLILRGGRSGPSAA